MVVELVNRLICLGALLLSDELLQVKAALKLGFRHICSTFPCIFSPLPLIEIFLVALIRIKLYSFIGLILLIDLRLKVFRILLVDHLVASLDDT